jgi:hypothetical protein
VRYLGLPICEYVSNTEHPNTTPCGRKSVGETPPQIPIGLEIVVRGGAFEFSMMYFKHFQVMSGSHHLMKISIHDSGSSSA